MPKKLTYTGSSKIIARICTTINDLIDSGGGGGPSDYTDLTNKPSINNVTLTGNKTSSDLGLISDANYVHTDNNYTTTEKNKLAGLVNYTLPTASANTLGGVKVGTNLSIDENGVLSATGGGSGSTVVVEQIQTTGTKIATITVDGDETDLYAPSGGSGGTSPLFYDSEGSICIDYDLLEVR